MKAISNLKWLFFLDRILFVNLLQPKNKIVQLMEITTIQKTLKKLSVKDINQGSSTGSNFFGSGQLIESFSPVDGKLIGKVTSTT